jgi:hypothetical protein
VQICVIVAERLCACSSLGVNPRREYFKKSSKIKVKWCISNVRGFACAFLNNNIIFAIMIE